MDMDPFATPDIEVPNEDTRIGLNLTSVSVHIYYPRAATIVAAIAAVLFMILGLIGNAVTILALWRSQKLLVHATTWFVLSLCFSDLLFCAINLPLTASRYIHEEWILGDTLCRLFPFFFYGNVATSLFSMVAITINRYVLIAHYSTYDRIYQKRNIIAMIAFVWIFSFSMLIPPLLEIWGRLGLEPHTFSCTILKNEDGRSPKKFLFVFGILIPCATIIFCYSCIYFKVRQSRRNVIAHRSLVNAGENGESQRRNSVQTRDDLRLTKMMLLIFCCFLLSFLPLLIFNVVDDEVKHPSLHVAASILAWGASVINPIIYAVANRQYRLAYYDLLWCGNGNGYKRTSTLPTSRSTGSGKTILTEMVPIPVETETEPGASNEKLDRLLPSTSTSCSQDSFAGAGAGIPE